jgi:DNA-binding GntR family transcriptional regulator
LEELEEEPAMTEELSRQSLYQYLNYIKLAVRVANEKLDLENLDQEQREQLALRQGTAMLAQELITRYGLASKPEDN